MSILRSATLLVGTLCFLSFTWAVPRHFVQHGRMPIGMRVLSLLTLLGFSWIVYSSLGEAKVTGAKPRVSVCFRRADRDSG